MKHFSRAEVFGVWKDYQVETIATKKGDMVKGTMVIERTYTYQKETKTQLIAVSFITNQYQDWSWLQNIEKGTCVLVIGGVSSREHEGKYYTEFMGREVMVSTLKAKNEETTPQEKPSDNVPF